MYEVSTATNIDRESWEGYLSRTKPRHHAYSWAWREIFQQSFGHTPHYLICRRSKENGVIAGVAPLFHVKSVLFGSALVSVPYLNAGGILADDAEAYRALQQAGEELGKKLAVKYLELRQRAPLSVPDHGLTERSHKVSMVLPLHGDAETLFASFSTKLRAQIKRPTKGGLSAEKDGAQKNAEESLAAFYSVFSEHMRNLGTPVYPRRLFSLTKKHFGESCRVITVWLEGRPVAAGITIAAQGSVEIPWASALKRHSKLSPNMLLYWEAIRTACIDGHEAFDFGRSSPDTGTYRFKEQWGAKPLPLYWYYRMFQGEMPDVNPHSPKYTALVSCWRRLPLPVANALGPWVTRSLP